MHVLGCFSRDPLCVTLWTAALQAPLSMGFSRQEYWSVLSCPPAGDLPDSGTKPMSLMPPTLATSLPLVLPGKPLWIYTWLCYFPLVTLYFEKCFLSVKLYQTVSENSKYPPGSHIQVHAWLWAEPLGASLLRPVLRSEAMPGGQEPLQMLPRLDSPSSGAGSWLVCAHSPQAKGLLCYKFGAIFSPQDQRAED